MPKTPILLMKQKQKPLIEALTTVKFLTLPGGSGAYPMGILHKMVHLLQKIDQ